jgi:hypothetical protein
MKVIHLNHLKVQFHRILKNRSNKHWTNTKPMKIHHLNAIVQCFFLYHKIELSMFVCLVNVSEPLPSLDMYQTTKRGLQVLLWTDLLKGLFLDLMKFCLYLGLNRFYDCSWLVVTWTDNNQLSVWKRSTFSSKIFRYIVLLKFILLFLAISWWTCSTSLCIRRRTLYCM